MAPVEGAGHDLGGRKLVLDQLDDAVGRFRLVHADQDQLGLLGARGAQRVQPGAVAVIDLEAELRGGLDHLDVVLDDRDVHVAGQQRLGHDLGEPAEADDQHLAAQVAREIHPVGALGRQRLARHQPAQHQGRQRRQGHGQDDDGRQHGPHLRREQARNHRRAVEDEGELPALGEQGRPLDRLAMGRPEQARHAIDAERLDHHEAQHAAQDDAPALDHHRHVQRHADAQEEQAQQDGAEGLHVRFQLVTEG
jgi:hypothetical protein